MRAAGPSVQPVRETRISIITRGIVSVNAIKQSVMLMAHHQGRPAFAGQRETFFVHVGAFHFCGDGYSGRFVMFHSMPVVLSLLRVIPYD